MEPMKDYTTQELSQLLQNRQFRILREIFEEYNVVDLAALVDRMPVDEITALFKILPKDKGAELLSYLDPDILEELTNNFTAAQIGGLLEHLFIDDLSDILSELPDELVKKVLSSATPEQRSDINALLSYKENSCGSIMSIDVVTLNLGDSVKEAMATIKKQGKMAETINWCYVVDPKGKLIGYVSLKDILFAKDDAMIEELIDYDVPQVKTEDDQEKAAKLISKYDITAIPVTDLEGILLGIITVDDVLDVVTEEATEDIQKMAAIIPLEDSYVETGIFPMFKSRITWLLVLMISATFTGSIINANNQLLVHITSLAIFIPMLMDTAGNAGSQSSTMVIRGIVVDDMGVKDFVKILWKELRVSFLAGGVLFAVNTLRIGLFMPEVGWTLALVVSATVFIVITLANLVGGLLPLLALAMKQDPAAMASPLITTVIDAVSLTVYFMIAAAVL